MSIPIAKKVMTRPKKIVLVGIVGGCAECWCVPKGVVVKIHDYDVLDTMDEDERIEQADYFEDEDGDWYQETIFEGK